jgi:UDP-4-amino-4,6-dideoxy-N-acetyl-beta-L-altrosamine transaminase
MEDKSNEPLPYGRQWIDEEDIAAVVEVLRGDWLTQGPMVERFEQALAEYCGAKFAVAVNSATSGLHIAAMAAGVKEGDVGITSPITFVASANCIAYCGGTPKFADIDPNTANISVEKLEEACEKNPPKVIVPVDFTGQPADLPEIYQIAKKYDATVIQDAAHSIGASYKDDGIEYKVGSCVHSDMAVLSFHPVKIVTTGEGGAVLTNDEDLYQKLSELRTHGITKDTKRLSRNDGGWYYEQQSLGLNYRITDFQSALGLSQMRRLDEFVARRRELVELYKKHFAEMSEDVQLLTESENKRSSYHLLVALVCGGMERRKNVFDYLQANNIRVQVHYIPVHFQPFYQEHFGVKEGDFPNAESYYSSCISLPMFPAMEDSDVERVAGVFAEALKENPLQ